MAIQYRQEVSVRKATRIVAAALGIFAGIGGPEHGYFEIMRGNTRPESLVFPAMGPPCDPEEIWNLCEPAMTVIPSFLVTGIVATLIGILTIIWAAAFIHRRNGGPVLILLSIALLLTGGGLFPPLIGIASGVVATRINKPSKRPPERTPGGITRALARLWPWPLVAFFVWLFGQFPIGYFFNDFLMESGAIIPLLIISLMVLAIISGCARDAHTQAGEPATWCFPDPPDRSTP
jgi:hypothetical protein